MLTRISLVLVGALLIFVGWPIVLQYQTDNPVGIVIPHHDLVASARQAYLEKISSFYQPNTVVIVAPDHFGQNNTPITTTRVNWQTALGELSADHILIDALQLPESETSFTHEHGVTTLLKDIKKYFPETTIVSVMMGRSATYAQVEEFTKKLYKNCPDCLMIASVDFSHTNATLVSKLHDRLTLRELYAADPIAIYKHAEVDSPEALTTLTLWGNLHNKSKFNLFSHTNSGDIAGITVGEVTSHIIGGFYRNNDPRTVLSDEITMMIGGDVMFGRGVFEQYVRNPKFSVFSNLGERFFWGVDIALVNLEGVFSRDNNVSSGWIEMPPRLRFDSVFATTLKQNRISDVGLANNHTYDGGDTDADFTKNILANLNINTLGYPRGTSSVLLKEEGKIKVAVITVASHEVVTDIGASVSYYSQRGYRTVVYIHWGQEYMQRANAVQEQMAQHLVDAGADLVVGSHPHVFQNVTVYNGVPIIYSLGNFLFDQAFQPETQVGAVLGATLQQNGIELFLLPVKSYLATEIMPEPEYSNLIGEWTEPWTSYQSGNQSFYFPATN